MIIQVDLRKLTDLTPTEYCFLYCIYKDVAQTWSWEVNLEKLIKLEYCRMVSSVEIGLKAKGLALFEKLDDFDLFIETYRNLFPKGVKSGNGTPIKGDKNGVIKKMKWFLETYPEFSKEIILEVTAKYLRAMQMKGWTFTTQADFFIQKDGSSKLAGMCEEALDKSVSNITSSEKRL